MIVNLCLIANYSLEYNYIQEFLDYYFNKIGIDQVYLYDYRLTDPDHRLTDIPYIANLVKQNKIVYHELTDWKYYEHQPLILQECYETHKHEFDWCCFFDCDEFLILKQHANIHEWLSDDLLGFDTDCNTVTVSWGLYGDAGNVYAVNGNVFDNYVKEDNRINTDVLYYKFIAKGGLDGLYIDNPHNVAVNDDFSKMKYQNGQVHNTDGWAVSWFSYEYAELAHVQFKSCEEFAKRKINELNKFLDLTPRNRYRYYTNLYFDYNERTQEKEDILYNQLNQMPLTIWACCVGNYNLEKNYVQEFCEHYLKLGVDKIYMFDDVHQDGHQLDEIPYIKGLIDEGKIIYHPIYDRTAQNFLYEDFYKDNNSKFDWCCFFDIDEYLILAKHDNLRDYLTDETIPFSRDVEVIQFSWAQCGDNDFLTPPTSGTLVENFGHNLTRIWGSNSKIIIRGGIKDKVNMVIGHCASSGHDDRIYYSNGELLGRCSDELEKYDLSVAYVMHLQTKSTQEFLARKSFGRIDFPQHSTKECMKYYTQVYRLICKWTEQKSLMFKKVYKDCGIL